MEYTLAYKSKSFTLMGILIFLLLNEVKQVYTDKIVTVDNSTCGTNFGASHKPVILEHVGSDILYNNPCFVEMLKWSDQRYLCVKGQEMELDCGTVLEYHQSSISKIYPPEKTFSCNNKSLEEWCPDQYVGTIFIVIRKSAVITSDVIKLQVYVKDVPKRRSTSNMAIYIATPIAAAVVFLLIVMCARMKSRNRGEGFPQVAYQTTSPSGTAGMNGETHAAPRA